MTMEEGPQPVKTAAPEVAVPSTDIGGSDDGAADVATQQADQTTSGGDVPQARADESLGEDFINPNREDAVGWESFYDSQKARPDWQSVEPYFELMQEAGIVKDTAALMGLSNLSWEQLILTPEFQALAQNQQEEFSAISRMGKEPKNLDQKDILPFYDPELREETDIEKVVEKLAKADGASLKGGAEADTPQEVTKDQESRARKILTRMMLVTGTIIAGGVGGANFGTLIDNFFSRANAHHTNWNRMNELHVGSENLMTVGMVEKILENKVDAVKLLVRWRDMYQKSGISVKTFDEIPQTVSGVDEASVKTLTTTRFKEILTEFQQPFRVESSSTNAQAALEMAVNQHLHNGEVRENYILDASVFHLFKTLVEQDQPLERINKAWQKPA